MKKSLVSFRDIVKNKNFKIVIFKRKKARFKVESPYFMLIKEKSNDQDRIEKRKTMREEQIKVTLVYYNSHNIYKNYF